MSEPTCTEFNIEDYKGHHLLVGNFSVLAVSSRHGLIYHKSVSLVDGLATHSVDDLYIEVQGNNITKIFHINI